MNIILEEIVFLTKSKFETGSVVVVLLLLLLALVVLILDQVDVPSSIGW